MFSYNAYYIITVNLELYAFKKYKSAKDRNRSIIHQPLTSVILPIAISDFNIHLSRT